MQESQIGSISKQWVKETREYFLEFLRLTRFPGIERQEEHGFPSDYPEWLIMLIGVLAVKCKEKTYLGIHRLSTKYWEESCSEEVSLPPISESQLRERLKKSASSLEWAQDTFIKFLHQTTCDEVISADKMMVRAVGPVWHRKQQSKGSPRKD